MALLGLHCYMGFSLVAVTGGYSLVVVHGLLIEVAFLVKHGLYGAVWYAGFSSCSSWLLEHRLNSCGTRDDWMASPVQ